MKYPKTTYTNFANFFATALEITKDKIGLYNQLVSPPLRDTTSSNGFAAFMSFVIYVLRVLGWYIYAALAGLVALGVIGYFGGMATLVAINPPLAAAIAVLGGGGVYLVWKHREFLMAQERVGSRYKLEFEQLSDRKDQDPGSHVQAVEKLIKQCVVSLCVEVFQINNDDAREKIGESLG